MKTLRIILIILTAALMLTVISGCAADQGKDTDDILKLKAQNSDRYYDAIGWGVIDLKRFPSEAQAKMAALEAARMDALAKLAETVNGLKIKGKTTVKDFVLQDKTIEGELSAFLKGAEEYERGVANDGGSAYSKVRIKKSDLERVLKITIVIE